MGILIEWICFFLLLLQEECLLENDPSKYFYVAQGMLTIDNVDDAEEMRLTSEAFDILGFTPVITECSFEEDSTFMS